MTLGDFLKARREEKGYTIEALSKKTSISGGQISRLENNEQKPRFETIIDLAKALEMDLNELAAKTGTSPLIIPMKDGKVTGRHYSTVRFEEEPPPIKEIIEETALRASQETIEQARSLFKEISNLVKKGKQLEAQEKEELPHIEGSLPVKLTNKTIKYPVISDKIACGYSLIPAEDEVDDWIELPETYAVNAEIVLRARGGCLDNEEIHDGYLVFIKCQNTASTGDIVAVRVIENSHGHAILKKLRVVKDNMFLTDKTGDIIEFKENMSIVGKAVYWMPDPEKFK